MGIVAKIFGTHSQRELKRILPVVAQIEALEERYKKLTDTELRGKTDEFRARLEKGETLDALLPEAYAVVREAAARILGLRAFHVQLIGAVVLHQGRIAEMRTGEGKTLTATFPCYLNALTGRGVHVVTVNDYLARYQSEMMGKVYRFLGLSVGLVIPGVEPQRRRLEYGADITYGTNNEFGFDYLRDNMAIYKEDMVQRGHNFAIVDEVDSILIDEARTPLIISGQGDKSTDLYERTNLLVSHMRAYRTVEIDTKSDQEDIDADYIVDEKARNAVLTRHGIAKAEKFFGVDNLSDMDNTTLMHHVNQAIRAWGVMQRDTDYVVQDGIVIIVDEFTGRLMHGRRYSEGLHQAIEAKEKVKVERESKTLATITFQNYFRLYEKLSGMTGTALTEEEEFGVIYKLDVIEIPTNKPVLRRDFNDVVYKTELAKFRAVITQIRECSESGQPVLVGTTSVEKSELLSGMLKREGVKHVVLNAKQHAREAEIVAQAGHIGAVTIATNMAGRGTDIMLGGNADYLAEADLRREGVPDEIIVEATGFAETENEQILDARDRYLALVKQYKGDISEKAEKVRAASGLFIIGTERHESRRVDNQLRGRSGRQGDPGMSRFFLSLEDDLMRLFGAGRVAGLMGGIDDDVALDQKLLSGAIESAQKRVESRNFQTRKHVLEYDDVMNKMREIIYGQRKKVLDGEDMRGYIVGMIEDSIERTVSRYLGESHYLELIQMEEICETFEGLFLKNDEMRLSREELDRTSGEEIIQRLKARANAVYEAKEKVLGPLVMREVERVCLLRTVDEKWMDHIDAMHELRQGIGLRAYAQVDPVQEYKKEGFDMFDEMINNIRDETVKLVYLAQIRGAEAPKREQVAKPAFAGLEGGGGASKQTRRVLKVGRNDPCPCGSGKKYKKCCGFTGEEG